MNTTIVVAVLTGSFGLVSGALVAYVSAILKFRKELESEFDKEIRKERMRVYQELWGHLEILARYDRPAPLTAQSLQDLSVAMRTWYFESGGILLSEQARRSYFALKEELRLAVENARAQGDGDAGADASTLVPAASLLRAHLTKDLGTRRSPALPDS